MARDMPDTDLRYVLLGHGESRKILSRGAVSALRDQSLFRTSSTGCD